MLLLGKIGYGLREFWIMQCIRCPHELIEKTRCRHTTCPAGKPPYIEEYTFTKITDADGVCRDLVRIQDDNLFNDIARFAQENKLLDPIEHLNKGTKYFLGQ